MQRASLYNPHPLNFSSSLNHCDGLKCPPLSQRVYLMCPWTQSSCTWYHIHSLLYFCCPMVLCCQCTPLVTRTKGVLPPEFHMEEAAVAPAIVCAVPCPVSGILRFMWCLLLLWLLLKRLGPCPAYQSLSCPLAESPLVFSEARISQH